MEPATIKRTVILPSSYTGGDRFMQQLYQDSMAIVRHFGQPTFFITFTANPKWKEIVDELLPGQTAVDRPDLVARVFHLKQQHLLQEIKKKIIFGPYLGCVWTIEYQKRGLPHMHLLLFVQTNLDFLTSANVVKIISAEIPDGSTEIERELASIIKSCMIHGPCGGVSPQATCMVQDSGSGLSKCSKHYPRNFQEETIIQENGYPLYRRRNNGQSFQIPLRGQQFGGTYNMDNRWIVPYNPYLSWKYKAHINVEICSTVQAVKYIHKYVFKGSDQTTVAISETSDEIKQHLHGRYIGPTEAAWRLFEFSIHEEKPPVIHLAIHLPGEQAV